MIYIVPVIVACLISAYFCFAVADVLSSLRNRASRSACIAVPVILSAFLIAFPGLILEPLAGFIASMQIEAEFGGSGGALIIAIAIALTVFGLLTASLIGQLRLLRGRTNAGK